MDEHKNLTVRDLYPHLTEEQLKEAEGNLDRYIKIAIEVYECLRSDPEAYARFRALTGKRAMTKMELEPASETNSP